MKRTLLLTALGTGLLAAACEPEETLVGAPEAAGTPVTGSSPSPTPSTPSMTGGGQVAAPVTNPAPSAMTNGPQTATPATPPTPAAPPPGAGGTPLPIPAAEAIARATKLLWNGAPDAELLAKAGKLKSREELAALVPTLLASPRAQDGLGAFYRWWLGLDGLATIKKDGATFPEWSPALRTALLTETQTFAVQVTLGERKLSRLYDADYSYVNADLARLYGIGGVTGADFVKTKLPAGRLGLVTQGSVLSLAGHAKFPSVSLRGIYVRERMLCQRIPAPPPGVTTTRELPTRADYGVHAKDVACAGCHKLVDPIGFSLHGFDAIGKARTLDGDGKTPVDTRGTIAGVGSPDVELAGPVDLGRTLAQLPEAQRCYTQKWVEYALGREPNAAEQNAIDAIHGKFAAGGFDIWTLVGAVVGSDLFLAPR